MPTTVIGNYPSVTRRETGLYSFDRAVGWPAKDRLGFPLRTIVETYGHPHVGKSTLTYFLSSKVNNEGTIYLTDLDGADPEYIKTTMDGVGFNGTVVLVSADLEGKPRPHADRAQEMTEALWDPAVSAGILDSVSSYVPRAEQEGDVGEAFMGRRAKEIAQIARRCMQNFTSPDIGPKAMFVVNHQYPRLGGQGHGVAGGVVLEGATNLKIQLWRHEKIVDDSDRADFVSAGKVKKLRFGGDGREFKVAIIAGRGIHPGMTAVYDCIDLGLVTKGGVVKLGDKSMGRMKALIEAAANGDDKKFDPFIAALKAYVPPPPKKGKTKETDAEEA